MSAGDRSLTPPPVVTAAAAVPSASAGTEPSRVAPFVSPADEGASEHWKRTLVLVWISQFLSIAAFGFGIPFAAYYIQQLGVTDPDQVLRWTALFQGAAPLAFCFAAPFWGMLADRVGRKPMLVRANFGAAVVLLAMGLAHTVPMLIILRVLQGLVTGTATASQTLVAAATPERRQGLALGALATAVFAGNTAGVALGGYCAELVGYGPSFFIGSGLALISGLLVAWGVKERFRRPLPPSAVGSREGEAAAAEAPSPGRLSVLATTFPLLALVGATSLTVHFDLPVLPLLVQALRGGLEGSALTMGHLAAVGSIASMIAGISVGNLGDRVAPNRVVGLCAFAAAACCIPFALAHTLGLSALYGARFALMFFAAGLDPIFQAWLSRSTERKRRGFVFGWASTAKSFGWMLGPLASSSAARALGLTGTYYIQLVLFVGLIPLAAWAGKKLGSRGLPRR